MKYIKLTLIIASALWMFLALNSCCRKCSKLPTNTFGNSTESVNGEYANCDLQIVEESTSVTTTGDGFVLNGVIKNAGDDDAQNPIILVSLPAETEIISFSASKYTSATQKTEKITCRQCKSFIQCDLKTNLPVFYKDSVNRKDLVLIEVKVKKPRFDSIPTTFGLYALPESPSDTYPDNNEYFWSNRRLD